MLPGQSIFLRILSLIVAISVTLAPPGIAETTLPEAAGIVFLHLKLHPNRAELLSSHVAPGRLKPATPIAGERILLQVHSTTGALLWEGTIEDPRREIIERGHDHAQHPPKIVERNVAEVMARVPFFEEEQLVRVVRVTPAPAAAAAHEKLLGTFRLNK
jgi:hypothetical protein